MLETINKLIRTSRYLVQEIGREPTPEEIAEKMELPLDKVRKLLKMVVWAIPKGTVLGYGEVAGLCGRPGGARAVVRALQALGHTVPWWRVVRSNRILAPEVAKAQARKLRAEGVEVVGGAVLPKPRRKGMPRVSRATGP